MNQISKRSPLLALPLLISASVYQLSPPVDPDELKLSLLPNSLMNSPYLMGFFGNPMTKPIFENAQFPYSYGDNPPIGGFFCLYNEFWKRCQLWGSVCHYQDWEEDRDSLRNESVSELAEICAHACHRHDRAPMRHFLPIRCLNRQRPSSLGFSRRPNGDIPGPLPHFVRRW